MPSQEAIEAKRAVDRARLEAEAAKRQADADLRRRVEQLEVTHRVLARTINPATIARYREVQVELDAAITEARRRGVLRVGGGDWL